MIFCNKSSRESVQFPNHMQFSMFVPLHLPTPGYASVMGNGGNMQYVTKVTDDMSNKDQAKGSSHRYIF